MFFVALPPEVNVGRLMSGPGPAPMTAAAATWAAYAGATSARSMFLMTLLPRLAQAWQAPETALMTQNVTRYLAWNELYRSQQILASTRHTAQAADYGAALAGMVHPPEIVQNHTTHATLQATNFLGVNTGAIAANEGEYTWMWGQNAAMMAAYLANTAANMTFVPFTPPQPIATGATAPPIASAAYSSVGEAVVTKLRLAATMAQMSVSALSKDLAGAVLVPAAAAASAAHKPAAVEAGANAANLRQTEAQQNTNASSKNKGDELMGSQLGQQLIQQLATQGPSQAGQVAQQVVQMPQQAAQQVLQAPQQAIQPLSQLMSSIYPEHRTPTVGYFGASPSSPTLDSLGGAGSSGAFGAAAVRGFVPTSFSAPSSWNLGGGGSSATPAAAPLVPRVPVEPFRPTGSPAGGGTSPLARGTGKQREKTVIRALDAMPVPVYQEAEAEAISEPVGAPSGGGDGA